MVEKNRIIIRRFKHEQYSVRSKKRKISFISEAHEKFYYEKIPKVREADVYHKALCYCLGINEDIISIVEVITSTAIAIYFGDWIKSDISINLITLLLLVHVVYIWTLFCGSIQIRCNDRDFNIEAKGWNDYTGEYSQIDSISYEENVLQNDNDYRTNVLET